MTSKEWKKCKLGEIAEFNPSESIKKGQLAKKIAMEKLIPYCKQIPSFERCKYNGGTKFRNGDTIMARITPCLENGKISKVTILNDNEIGFGSTEYIVFRAIENLSNPDFLYYLITSSLVREPAIKSMVGSSGRQRVQIDVVKNIEIGIPPLETQQKIASILSSIDDKIELNNSINNNLEQQAQALFYEIYNNGKCGTIGDILEIIETGSRPKGGALTHGVPSIGAENINGFGVYDYSKDKFISAEFYNKLNRGIVKSKDVLLYKD
ncbi:type I restriction-modification system specificity subunit [Clostridium sp. CAG:715]|nr:type I restriction-modification system specificity subunit [Clostridium sp. CAG:715]